MKAVRDITVHQEIFAVKKFLRLSVGELRFAGVLWLVDYWYEFDQYTATWSDLCPLRVWQTKQET